MSWIDVVWIMMASASLTLGLIHLFVWHRSRTQYANPLFFTLAAAVAVVGIFELVTARAQTPAAYSAAVRWSNVPLCVVVLSILGFVRSYFDAGRPWLAYAAGGLRLLALLPNFLTGESVQFQEVTGLVHVTLWGGASVAAPIAVLNPWLIVLQISNVALLAYVADASVTFWRRGAAVDRRRAVLVGGGLVLCIVTAAILGMLILAGKLRLPIVLTPCYFVVVLAMGYELGRDVVRAAQLAADLRESERRMELAAQAAELAFWSWDVARDEIWIAVTGRTLLGLAGSERIDLGRLLAQVHPDDRDAVGGAIKEARRGRGVFEQEFRLVPTHGKTRWIAARGQFEFDKAGVPLLLRGVALDISARRQLERQAAEQRSELAHLARVATLGEISGSLAHEINQPLMGILSNAQAAQRFMAADNVNFDEVREILADIVEDDKRAGEVIRRLRALLKKGEVQHEPIDINDVVDDVLRLMRNDLMNRDVVATAVLAPDLPAVLGDRIQLQQVLLNLVINACDAMDGGSVTRRLHIRTHLADVAGVEVSVSDQGGGVPPADLERIFEPFTTTKEHGMGLGLSVCRSIVLAHGGRLWAENNTGPGATFRFTVLVSGCAG